jgi:hypothetical protein
MVEPLQPTPYADVNTALHDLEARIRTILGDNFRGMYLSGSLALGDFDPHGSDIDFVVVTDQAISEDLFAALGEMHARFDAEGSPWAAKVEAVYAPRDALHYHAPTDERYPQIEKGKALFMDRLESGWIYHCYTLREFGMAVAGPDPRTLIDPVDPDDMRRAAAPIAEMWLEQAHSDPSWLAWVRQRSSQSFVVLTLCRLLYTLDTGSVTSKPAAARWAEEALGTRWVGLITRSLAGKHDGADTPDSDVSDTVALIEYTVDRFRQYFGKPLDSQVT